MCLRWLIFVSLACITSQQSTIRVRLTNKGLHFFSDEGHHILEHEVRKIDFPQISFPITRGPGTGIVNVTNLKIGQFTSPNIQLKLAPPNGIGWKTEGGSVKLVGDWQAVYKLLVPISTSGYVKASAVDIRTVLQADIDVDGRRPQLNIGACSMDVQGVDVIVGGGVLPWIVNLFRPELSALVREEIRSQLCITLQTVLLEKVNEILHSLPTHIQIANNFFLNYRCEEKPLSTNSFIEGEMYSDIVYENTTCDLPIRYMDHEVGRAKYMTHIWVSDHIPNCLLLSAHSANLLNFIIDKNFDKGKFKSLLSTSCSFISLCIGRFFPILREHYPNEFVDLRFNTADTPNVAIVPSGVSINVLLDVDLFISPWTEHKDALARLAANISFDVLPSILNKSLTGTIENVTVVIVEVKSIIGHLNQRFIAILETLTRDAIEVLAISALRVGIHLPLVDNVTLADDAHIVSGQGFIRIDSDFIYQ